MRKHATSRIREMESPNSRISGKYRKIPLQYRDFPLLKSDFPHLNSDFPRTKPDSPKSAFYFLFWLSAFFNGFLLSLTAFSFSSTAFRFLQRLSDFFRISPTAFRFSSTAFRFPRNPRKSNYGEKYTKFRYSSFVIPATRSPSFVIPAKQYLHFTQHTPVVHLCSQQCTITII